MAKAISIETLNGYIAHRREMLGRENHPPGSEGARGDIFQEAELARLESKVGDWELNRTWGETGPVIGDEPEGGIA